MEEKKLERENSGSTSDFYLQQPLYLIDLARALLTTNADDGTDVETYPRTPPAKMSQTIAVR